MVFWAVHKKIRLCAVVHWVEECSERTGPAGVGVTSEMSARNIQACKGGGDKTTALSPLCPSVVFSSCRTPTLPSWTDGSVRVNTAGESCRDKVSCQFVQLLSSCGMTERSWRSCHDIFCWISILKAKLSYFGPPASRQTNSFKRIRKGIRLD